MSYGAQMKFGIARQTVGGTAVTAVGSFFPLAVVNEGLSLEKEELISQNLSGRFEQGAVYDGVSTVRGTIEFEVTRGLGATGPTWGGTGTGRPRSSAPSRRS
jgi:hypothetical protein